MAEHNETIAFDGLNMPYSLDSEQSVLGAILLDPACISSEGVDLLRPEHFYLPQHQAIFGAIYGMFALAKPIDFVTVLEELRNCGDYETAGGKEYLMQLAQLVPSVENVKAYADTVMEKYYIRCLIKAGRETVAEATEGAEAASVLLDAAEQRIFVIRQGRDTSGLVSLKEVLAQETLDKLNKLSDPVLQKEMQGIPTGLSTLDKVLGGLGRSDLIVIGARPGMGKTSFALNIARNVAVGSKKKVAFFSLEMTKDQLAQRLLSSETAVDVTKFRRGGLTMEEWDRITYATNIFYQSEIYLDDTAAITVPQMKSKLRRNKPDLVVIDYLQLMESAKRVENRVQQVSEITRSLKIMAKELNIPVIVCSQLARGTEARGKSHVPQLSDLRESGSIEQDADIVMMLYRPDYYQNEDSEEETDENAAQCIVAKNRHGATGTVDLFWDGRYTKYTAVESDYDER